jgi:lipooligosaccharide transport system permease protein
LKIAEKGEGGEKMAALSWRFVKIWYRNLLVYRRVWKIDFLLPLLEPVFYLLAFGLGIGGLIENIRYGGSAVPYVTYIAPALLSINMMSAAFFENTYASFVRMYYQKTYDAMLATPLSLEDVITGEIMWGGTKSLLGTAIMLAVISAFGLIRYPGGLLIIPLSFIGGLMFGALGMFFTAILPTIDMFNLPVFLLITPMFLLGDTFFPVTNLPAWVQKIALVFPLTHLCRLSRGVSSNLYDRLYLWHFAYMVAASLILYLLSLFFMKRRLLR